MTRSHAYKQITEAMSIIENINLYEMESRTVRILNQQKLHKAFNILNNFRDEIIREDIMCKQRNKSKG